MKRRGQGPEMIDDGLLAYRNVTAYVCDAEEGPQHGYDAHLNIGENQELGHICFEATDTLCNRGTPREAWEDAAEWLHATAQTLQAMASYIRSNDFFEGWGEGE